MMKLNGDYLSIISESIIDAISQDKNIFVNNIAYLLIFP